MSALAFEPPQGLEATEPPEARGLDRDGVRLLVAQADGGIFHARFRPLAAYQNVYAISPGSAEMPSAGRPFTERLITAVVARGIGVAPITLHTGVSSSERDEPPFPEQYEVPAPTARQIGLTRDSGGRVVAVGTTVVRALETGADANGTVAPGAGWTGLRIGPGRGARSVDGIIPGRHELEACIAG